tara:strand:- start:34 stop:630 length:597 start_codon:yes stop_codon:yes gene_type:complete
MYKSETARHREYYESYINSDNIIDLGFGGDKVTSNAVSSDLPSPLSHTGDDNNDIPADITKGLPIESNRFDVVYSSHLIEDFIDTASILNEMIRILKDGGRLILMFPDEQRYRKNTPSGRNGHHKHLNMGLAFMKSRMREVSQRFGHRITTVYERDNPEDFEGYNVILICDIEKETLSEEERSKIYVSSLPMETMWGK